MDNSLSLKAQHLSLVAGMLTWLTTCSYLVKVCSMLFLVSFVGVEVRHAPLCAAYIIGFYTLWLTDGYLMSRYMAYRSLYDDVSRGPFDDKFSLNASMYMTLKRFALALAAKTVMPFYVVLITAVCTIIL